MDTISSLVSQSISTREEKRRRDEEVERRNAEYRKNKIEKIRTEIRSMLQSELPSPYLYEDLNPDQYGTIGCILKNKTLVGYVIVSYRTTEFRGSDEVASQECDYILASFRRVLNVDDSSYASGSTGIFGSDEEQLVQIVKEFRGSIAHWISSGGRS